MSTLDKFGYTGPLKEYISDNRPFFGICLGLQTLFESRFVSGLKLDYFDGLVCSCFVLQLCFALRLSC